MEMTAMASMRVSPRRPEIDRVMAMLNYSINSVHMIYSTIHHRSYHDLQELRRDRDSHVCRPLKVRLEVQQHSPWAIDLWHAEITFYNVPCGG